MIKLLFIYMTYFMSFLFLFTIFLLILNINNHPISIMIILLFYSMLICLNMSLWKSNYMLSILLFLMIISGLLIIFLYFSSLISNDQFKLKFNYFMISLNLINLTCLYYLMKLNFPLNLFINKYKFYEIYPLIHSSKILFYNIQNLYEYPSYNLTIMSMFYLLFSLFSIIKICSSKSITLRKIN